MTWTHGNFHWNELMTHDPEQAKRFYQDAIGWRFEPMPIANGTYWIAHCADRPVGGLFPMNGPEFEQVQESWMPYLAVDDVDARVAKATAAGATVCRAPFDVASVGRIAVLREPGGAMVGWITPAT